VSQCISDLRMLMKMYRKEKQLDLSFSSTYLVSFATRSTPFVLIPDAYLGFGSLRKVISLHWRKGSGFSGSGQFFLRTENLWTSTPLALKPLKCYSYSILSLVVLQTCKQLYHDATDYFYSRHVLTIVASFVHTLLNSLSCSTCSRWLTSRS
jgi:hypothetical protein